MNTIHITLWAFLRSMLSIAWNALRHPFSTTIVDLSTGRTIDPKDVAEDD
jgi:hypothetical protein